MKAWKRLVSIIVLSLMGWVAGMASTLAEENGFHDPAEKILTINGAAITREDFDREMDQVQKQYLEPGQRFGEAQLQTIKQGVLDNLIRSELLFQESRKQGVLVDEAAVNAQIEQMKKQFVSNAEYRKALVQLGRSEVELIEELRRGLAIRQLVDQQIARGISVSDEEIRSYYAGHTDSFQEPEQVRASHILIKAAPDADDAEKNKSRKKLEGIRERILNGEDFAALARKYSDGPSGKRGGDLGYFPREKMVRAFSDVAFALKPGAVSDIVQTIYGYHLIKQIDRIPARTILFEEIKEGLADSLTRKKIQESLIKYANGLKKNATIKKIAADI